MAAASFLCNIPGLPILCVRRDLSFRARRQRGTTNRSWAGAIYPKPAPEPRPKESRRRHERRQRIHVCLQQRDQADDRGENDTVPDDGFEDVGLPADLVGGGGG